MLQSNVIERIKSRITVNDDGCWIYPSQGYGRISYKGKPNYVHRVIYEEMYGIPEGLTIDHLCNVKACCNPEHLEAVTAAENSRRAAPFRHRYQLTKCSKGHSLSGDNLYAYKGQRRCRKCKREYDKERYLAQKEIHD